MRFDAKLVCLIGANEAGKSTILDALETAQHNNPVESADRTRRADVPDSQEVVRMQFRLDDADQQALAQIDRDADGPQAPRWFIVSKHAGGQLVSWAEPELIRDRAPRAAMRRRLLSRVEHWWPHAETSEADDDAEGGAGAPTADEESHFTPDAERVTGLLAALDSEDSTLPETVPSELRELASELDPHDADLAAEVRQVADVEAATPPDEQADALLRERMPRFARFDDRARLLESEYDLNAADMSAGTALGNLIRLAELDVGGLRRAINAGESGTVRDIRERANATLATRMEAWQQEPRITVALENEGSLLRVHVQSGSGPTMAFRERSDGLRQFVALVALTAHQPNPVRPILLIDEVETHLHYNAQADLIDVLTTQAAASQVVYTTHSAACLPQDLGFGVRVVETIGEQTASTVRQNFWQDEHPGLGALLMALGASSLVYVTLRPAIIAEGGSDLILLPSLFREAIGRDSIGFAVVPGASTSPPEQIAGLGLQGVKTAWVLDADKGGRARRKHLVEAGVPEDRVVLLADEGDLEIEDLIAPETYVRAVRDYLKDVGATDQFGDSDLPGSTCQRHETVAAWCEARQIRKPSKIAIANKIIGLTGEVHLLADAQRDELRRLHSRVAALFEP